MSKLHAVLAVALIATASASLAKAQDAGLRREKEGFYGSLGVGYGSLSVSCSGCGSSSTNSTSLFAEAGATLNRSVRLGVEYNQWRKTEDGFTLAVPYYLAVATFYPSLNNDLWLKVGAGWTNATGSGGGESASSNGGAAGSVGLGYDWRVSQGGFAVVPFMSYTAQLSSSGGEGKTNELQFGVGIGYRH